MQFVGVAVSGVGFLSTLTWRIRGIPNLMHRYDRHQGEGCDCDDGRSRW